MSIAVVILVLGVAGLVLVALLVLREPDARIRVAVTAAALGGFLVALLAGLAFVETVLAALATAAIGGAVLALALIGQWRFFRSLYARQGRKL
jgi:hypothetical protein